MNQDIDSLLLYAENEIRTSNAVAIIGAGTSFRAGMPLAGQLPPLVWMTLDANPNARSKLAERLGVPDTLSKQIVGDDWQRLKEAFAVIAASQGVRHTFQEAFARLDKARSLRSSPSHHAIAQLTHSGIIELIISLNWDTLIENAWTLLYGTSINANVVRLLKPHGDASNPHGVWTLPHEPGHIPDEVINRVYSLARERPRTLLVVGYSERDEVIIDRLIGPLVERWRVIRVGPNAIGMNGILLTAESALPMLADRLCPEPQVPGWTHVTFTNLRGLESAIAGQRLGPADVVACPRLPQLAAAHRQLDVVNHVEITGPAGCGKSITAYQIAYDFLQRGWEVLRPSDAVEFEHVLLRSASELADKTVLVVDDGQTFTPQFRMELSELASYTRKVLITITDRDADIPGTIRISNSAAVDTLHRAYLKRRDEVLPIVSRLDNHIGERYLDTSIEHRINEAAKAETPWQFNFILRGGWQRARDEIDVLRDLDRADLLLIPIAVRQILYLDSAVPIDWIDHCARTLGRDSDWVSKSYEVLQKRQVILPGGPLRCPHIRFASVALKCFFKSSKDPEYRSVVRLISEILCEEEVPLLGISWLLNDLRFADALRFQREHVIVTETIWQKLVTRCLNVTDSIERRNAAFALDALAQWVQDGYKRLASHLNVIVRWIEQAEDKSAYGIANLINNLYNADHDLIHDLVGQVCPETVARRLSEASCEGGYAWGYLLGRLHLGTDEQWRIKFKASINKESLNKLIENFDNEEIGHMSDLICGIALYDEELAFRLLNAGFSTIDKALNESPLSTWEEMKNIIWFLLGHIPKFLRHRKPDRRQREYSRRIARCLPIKKIAADLSHSRQRDWERYTRFVGEWLHEVDKRQYGRIIRSVDLNQLDEMTRGLWATPPRDLRLLISTLACDKGGEPAKSWVKLHADELEEIDPITTYVAPEVAASVAERGGRVNIFGHNGHEWGLAAYAVACLAKIDLTVACRVVENNLGRIIERISGLQTIDCDGLSSFLDVLSKLDAKLPQRILNMVDAEKAEKHWMMRLREKSKSKRTVAKLVVIAKQCEGDIAQVAQRLETRIPKRFLETH